jgi:hypothetical protein
MAIVTCRVQQRDDFRRRVGDRQITHDRRICARRVRELQQDKRRDERDKDPFQSFLHLMMLK